MKPALQFLIILFPGIISFTAHAQSDTTKILNEVVVTAYRSNRSINFVPAAIGTIGTKELSRFNTTSFVPAVNTIPGVRMEERSPGSYRLSIRGSFLRSPFGIRNVKFYWNGLPLTDGGGNTYFNLIDNNSVSGIEIIKGPGASLYGAGTGGVVLLTSAINNAKPTFSYSAVAGSFGLFKIQGNGTIISTEKSTVALGSSYQQANGYRDHTNMKRFSTNLDWICQFNENNSLTTTFFATNLFYETPGGLTKAQFEDDPAQARPATTTSPGAVEQKTFVKNISTYIGTMFTHDWSSQWKTQVGIFTSLTSFTNPTIRNYEIRDEKNFGGRTETQGDFKTGDVKWRLTAGAEYQYFVSPVDVFDNNAGKSGNLQTSDKLWSSGGIVFSQAEMEFQNQVFVTVGVSANFLQYKFLHTSVSPEVTQHMRFDTNYFPRIALLKRFKTFSLFGSISSGYSPPTLAEVRPSTGSFNENLKPESGINLEMGIRGNVSKHLSFDLVAFDFQLHQTIVIQRAPDGADYFINAGDTKQRGLESTLRWSVINGAGIDEFKIWLSYTLNDFYFGTYVQDGVDYSNNRLTGVAPNILVLGADLVRPGGFYIHATLNYTDHLPLNDANSEFASQYFLAGTRLGLKKSTAKLKYDFFIGVDNAFNQRYSLGNDLNASGGRYYNAAPVRSYFVGLQISI